MQETETDERWYVQFDSGQVQLMTLEELDAAFDAGEVHENTFVIQVGETQWQTLADVAGLSEEEDSGEPEVEAEVEPEPTTLYTPAHAASLQAAAHAPPLPMAPQQALGTYSQQAQRAPAPQAPSPGPSARPAVAVAAGGWPPIATPAVAPQSSWPPAAVSRSSGGYNIGPQSMIPVVNDVDLDFNAPSFKSGRKTALIAVFAAIPALGGGGYALMRLDAPPQAAAAAAPAPVAPQKTSPWTPPASSPTPPPATPTPTPEAKSDSGATGRLSDDMKKALLASDSGRAPKQKARSAAPARSTASAGSKKGSTVFKSGGNANDPLNSNL